MYDPAGGPVDLRLLEAMTQAQAHRGPDGEGYVLLDPTGHGKPLPVMGSLSASLRSVAPGYAVGLGHRRLAVLDLSPLGRQPMSSEDGAAWITYNGEVYNYRELRQDLQQRGRVFRSMTDTEVVLQAYLEWGAACLQRLNGMFAFAVWDGHRNRLFCARDRLGMKPFYYRASRDRVAFGSEIKALLEDSTPTRSPNLKLIHDFLVLGLQDHTDETFFEGIRQLRPGHYLLVEDGRLEVRKWWDLDHADTQGAPSDDEAVRSFGALFEDAVRLHLRSDVSVGSCLSGGLDSSSIVCLIRRIQREERLQTFSACFDDPACDERPFLRDVVAHAGADGVEVVPDGRRLFDEMPLVLWHQEEPFGGTSYLAQWAVMRAASERGVKVLLDGQGGDELLCGYPGYWGSYLTDLARALKVRTFAREARAYGKNPQAVHETVFSNAARAMLPAGVVSGARRWLKGHASWVNRDFAMRYRSTPMYERRFPTALENHVAAYLQTHSLPALLHHEDRNAMAFSIEARLPFLDVRLVDFLMRLPAGLKLRHGRSKYVLREAMAGIIPESVRARADKMGFVTPQDRWLRETLRPDLDDLFRSRAFAQRGYWHADRVREEYRKYCRGGSKIGGSVWRWACLELWHRRFFP
jgi:asparagine synthase (glutamine-hydrolysing)